MGLIVTPLFLKANKLSNPVDVGFFSAYAIGFVACEIF